MPEPKQSTLDTLAEMLAEYKLKITRLEVALSHRENRFDAMEAKNKELEDRLADCAKRKKDDTVPEARNKLQAYWIGRGNGVKESEKLITEVTKERDALKDKISNLKANVYPIKRVEELEKSLRESELMFQVECEAVHDRDKTISELRKEKEHYEKVAQDNTDRVINLTQVITGLRKEVEEFKANNRYHRGHSAGYAEALTKVQDFVLKSRE